MTIGYLNGAVKFWKMCLKKKMMMMMHVMVALLKLFRMRTNWTDENFFLKYIYMIAETGPPSLVDGGRFCWSTLGHNLLTVVEGMSNREAGFFVPVHLDIKCMLKWYQMSQILQYGANIYQNPKHTYVEDHTTYGG